MRKYKKKKKRLATGIVKLPDGRIQVRSTAKCPKTGKILEAVRTMDPGSQTASAVKLRREMKAMLLQQDPDTSSGPQITTLADYADEWIIRKVRRWKPSSADSAIYILSHHILPRLGHVPLEKITRRDVTEWVMWVEQRTMQDSEKLYARATVKSWWRIFRMLLKDAHAQGFLETDLSARQDSPDTGTAPRQEKRTLSAEDLTRLVESARSHQPRRYAEIATLAYTGMRAGELCALHWEDVDLSNRVITVRASAHKGRRGTPKTGVTRTVPIVDLVAEALESHRQQQIRSQAPGLERGIVFPSTRGTYRYGESLAKPLRLLQEHLGLDVRVTPQVLRRTFNTLLLRAQVDRITIRSITGHSSEQMTEHYAGIPVSMKHEAVGNLLGSLLGGSSATWEFGNEEE